MALRPRLSTGLPLSQRFSQVSAPRMYLCGHGRSLIPACGDLWLVEGLFTQLPRNRVLRSSLSVEGHLFICRLSGSLDQPAVIRLFNELPDVLSMLNAPVPADDEHRSGQQPQLFDQDPVIDAELFIPMG